MNKEISLAQAKATLSIYIRDAEKGLKVLIKRHGKPAAALVHPQDLENLERQKKAGSEGGLARIAGGWEGSKELVQVLDESVRFGRRDGVELE